MYSNAVMSYLRTENLFVEMYIYTCSVGLVNITKTLRNWTYYN